MPQPTPSAMSTSTSSAATAAPDPLASEHAARTESAQASTPSSDRRSAALGAAPVVMPAIVLAVLAGDRAVRFGLSRDEAATRLFAELSMPDLFGAVQQVDLVALPYYFVVHAVLGVVPGVVGLRLMSVLAAVAAAVLVALLARRWWGSGAAVVAGIAFAVNPLTVQMAATARPAALATLCTAVALVVVDRAVVARGRAAAWWWAAYAASALMAGLVHLFAVLAVLATGLLAVAHGRRTAAAWAGASVAGLLVLTPFAVAASAQAGQVAWMDEVDAPRALAILANVVTEPERLALGLVDLIAVLALASGAALAIAAARRIDRTPERAVGIGRIVVGVGVLVAPWLVLWFASIAVSPVLRTAYLAPSAVGVAVIVGATAAVGFGCVGPTRRRANAPSSARRMGAVEWRSVAAVASALLVILSMMVAPVRGQTATWRQDDFAGLALELARRAEPGDRLAVVQQRHETGLAAGIARALGDDDWYDEVASRLADGSTPRLDVRRVLSVVPFAAAPQSADRGCVSWIVSAGPIEAGDRSIGGTDVAADDRAHDNFGGLRLTATGCVEP